MSPIALGTNTDPYQPVERDLKVTRGILELLLERKHPATIVTKGALILRDLDVLRALAEQNLVAVHVSVTTLDDELKRRMEPRTAGPKQRLNMIRQLAAAGIPTGVMAAPMIPALNDHELEGMLEAAAEHGAGSAGYVLLRLPHEVEPLFVEWLRAHYPDRAEHVLCLVAPAAWRRAVRQPIPSPPTRGRPVRRPAESPFCQGAPPLRARARSRAAHGPFRSAASRAAPAGPWFLVSIILGRPGPSLGSAARICGNLQPN